MKCMHYTPFYSVFTEKLVNNAKLKFNTSTATMSKVTGTNVYIEQTNIQQIHLSYMYLNSTGSRRRGGILCILCKCTQWKDLLILEIHTKCTGWLPRTGTFTALIQRQFSNIKTIALSVM